MEMGRWCAKGYGQAKGVNYNQAYTPVAKLSSFRILLSLAAKYKLQLQQFDVASACLNGEIEEDVNVQQPVGFEKPGKEHLVYKLKKALYGTMQGGHVWNNKFSAEMNKLGYTRCTADRSLWTKRGSNTLVCVLL